MSKRLIVVVGMHRSGTSAITRALKVVGVELGNKLLPEQDYNLKGLWEDYELMALNWDMLNSLGKEWNSLSLVSINDVKKLQQAGYMSKAVELIQSKMADVDVFGFKDPRVAKLLPFWSEVFQLCNLDVSYVLALRHPLSVALSLRERDGFDLIIGYTLWLGHVVEGLISTEGYRRVLVDYDLLMASPEHELSRIANQLELLINNEELKLYKEEFLDQNLRHSQFDVIDFENDENCPELVREIYTALLDVASERNDLNSKDIAIKSALWLQELSRQASLLKLVDSINAMSAERDSQLAERDSQLAERDSQLAEKDAQLAEKDAQLTDIFRSLSWKLTAPLRVFTFIGKRIRTLYGS